MVRNLPAWIEAGGVILAAMATAVAVSSITLYRLGALEDKVDELIVSIQNVRVMEQEVKDLKKHNDKVMNIFFKFSDSVDRLSITVAKLETKVDLREDK